MLNNIEILEAKVRPMLTANLYTLLLELDKQIEAERIIAAKTENFTKMQSINTVRTAVINVLDERDPSIFDKYCDAKAAA